MKRLVIIIVAILISLSINAQTEQAKPKMDFNGYIQIRGMTNFNDNTEFMLRRLKLWIKSTPEFSKHWYYKLQTTLTSLRQESFFLQDAKLGYKTGLWSVDIGQFVPQYSLQRFQSDYKLPVIERAKTINVLIPDGTIGVRDIGIQLNYGKKHDFFQTHIGIFNGYGIKKFVFENQGFMITHKSQINYEIFNGEMKLGYSLQYRKAKNLNIPSLMPDTVLFSGNDFRYNIFLKYRNDHLWMQAEYLTASLNNQKAYGYYFMATYRFLSKNELVVDYEKFHSLIPNANDKPYVHLGYNYYIKDYKIRFSIDNYFRVSSSYIDDYLLSLQMQLFLQ